MSGKRLVSFDVKSLFTNVPVEGALQAVEKVLDKISDDELLVGKEDYMDLVRKYVGFGMFVFEGEEYRQHEGLAMGSPLSAVIASLYMEMLEAEHFRHLLSPSSSWFRHIDDVLVSIHHRARVDRLLSSLNEIEHKIQFTHEGDHAIKKIRNIISVL